MKNLYLSLALGLAVATSAMAMDGQKAMEHQGVDLKLRTSEMMAANKAANDAKAVWKGQADQLGLVGKARKTIPEFYDYKILNVTEKVKFREHELGELKALLANPNMKAKKDYLAMRLSHVEAKLRDYTTGPKKDWPKASGRVVTQKEIIAELRAAIESTDPEAANKYLAEKIKSHEEHLIAFPIKLEKLRKAKEAALAAQKVVEEDAADSGQ